MYKRLTFFHRAIWIDLETTGLNPNNCAIIQIAAAVEEHGKISDKFITYVQPFKGAKIEPEALNVNKISKDDFPDFPGEHEVFNQLMDFLNNHVDPSDKTTRLTVSGFNVGFDVGFLKAMFERNKKPDLFYKYFHKYNYDVAGDIAKARLLQRIDPDQSMALNKLCRKFGVKLNKAHDAEYDILATRKLSHKVVELINDLTDPYNNGPDTKEQELISKSNKKKTGIPRFWAMYNEWNKL